MSPSDFDEIARLWQQEPSPDEERAFQQMARKASGRARWLDRAETGLAILLVAAVLIALFLAPEPATIAVGILTVVAISWSSWKRHMLGQVDAMVVDGDRRSFIDAAVAQVAASLRRSTFGLWLLLPGILLGALLRHSYDREGFDGFGEALLSAAADWPIGPAVVAAMILSFALLVRSNLRLRGELKRLRNLRDEYRREAKLDEAPPG